MPNFLAQLPLSLYVHIPWCVRKCPYCDFNSHAQNGALPENNYVSALIDELDGYLPLIADRKIISIFFGGGTPSLFSAQAIAKILQSVSARIEFSDDIEITLEANPGTVDSANYAGFREAGINRLSLGVQSLQKEKLRALGRIHDEVCAHRAIETAIAAGFDNYNIDLMFGLPNQSIADAMYDLQAALHYAPPHISWYQLTIEPNTFFAHCPPTLPQDETAWEMQVAGVALLRNAKIEQYEVSAYARGDQFCRHNQNYWQFGDYLGIGAGAHSKLTNIANGEVTRFSQVRHPKDYLQTEKRSMVMLNKSKRVLSDEDLIFEFMLNALRLTQGFSLDLFSSRTGLAKERIRHHLEKAKARGFLQNAASKMSQEFIHTTDLGKRFLNNLMMLFLP